MKMNAGAWIGIIGGIVGLLVGVAAVVSTGGSTGLYAGGGMLLVFGGMFYLFYRLFFKQLINTSRLMKTGTPGRAKILEVKDTGVTINNNPQVKLTLEVKNSLGQKYTTHTRVLVSRLNVGAFTPGMEIAVRIDPKNEMNVVVDRGTDTSIHVPRQQQTLQMTMTESQLKTELEQLQQENDRILLSGKAARAVIKKNTFLGANVNGNNPYVELEVEVLPDNAPAFSGTARGVIAEASLHKYQPGNIIFVKYDLYDNSKVTVDHA